MRLDIVISLQVQSYILGTQGSVLCNTVRHVGLPCAVHGVCAVVYVLTVPERKALSLASRNFDFNQIIKYKLYQRTRMDFKNTTHTLVNIVFTFVIFHSHFIINKKETSTKQP